MADFAIPSVDCVEAHGDTIADIREGINAKAWTVGVVLGSNELGLTQEEVPPRLPMSLEARKGRCLPPHACRRCPLCGRYHCRAPRSHREINRKLEIL